MSNNNFSIQVTIDVKDKLETKLKELEKRFDSSKKKAKEFREESVKSEKQEKQSTKVIKEKTEEMRKQEWQQRRLRQAEQKRWLEEERGQKKQGVIRRTLATSIGKVGAALVAGWGVQKIVTDLAHFDDALRRMKSNRLHDFHGNMKEANAQATTLGNTMQTLSAKYGKSVSELSHTAESLSKIWTLTDINNGLESIVKTSINLGSGLDETANAMQTIKTLYPEMQMEDIFQQTSFAIDGANMTLSEYAQALANAGSTASAFKQDANDMILILRKLAGENIKGGQAGTTVKALITSLASPMTAKKLQPLGLSFKETDIQKLGIIKVLDNINKQIAITEKKKGGEEIIANALRNAFGQAYIGSFKQIIQNVETIKATKTEQQKFYEEKQASKMLAERQGGLQTSLSKLQSSISNFVLALEPLIPIITQIVNTLTNIITPLARLTGTIIKPIASGIDYAVGAVLNPDEILKNTPSQTEKPTFTKRTTSPQALSGINEVVSMYNNIKPQNFEKTNIIDKAMQQTFTPMNQKQSINSNTSISIDIIDKVGVQALINNVKKDDKGSVKINKQSKAKIDPSNY
jgi:TP901 family phage tail tape measure protein